MIEVSKAQLNQLRYLIHQSLQGNHVLFDPETLRHAVHETEGLLAVDDLYAVEHHLERMLEQPTLDHKRAYLERLDARTHHLVVRSYLTIIEDNLFESSRDLH